MKSFAEQLERKKPRDGIIQSIEITECELNGKIFSYKATVVITKHYYKEGHTRSTEEVNRRLILNEEQISTI
jgi:hypothetical protein